LATFAVALRALAGAFSGVGAWNSGTGTAAFLRVFGAAGSAGSVNPASVTTAVSGASADGDRDFFDDFFTARLRGVFGSIAIYKYLHFKI
jgi:hypothetical protein